LQSVSECNAEDWFPKRRFCDFNWLPWQRPLKYRKIIYRINKPFHVSTNPEILVKIGPSDSEKRMLESIEIYSLSNRNITVYTVYPEVLERRPLKNIKLEMRG